MRFDHEPEWRKFWLAEPQERVRELPSDEAERIEAATREDYAPFFAFAMASGPRLNECLLRWSEVDWNARGRSGSRARAADGSRSRSRRRFATSYGR